MPANKKTILFLIAVTNTLCSICHAREGSLSMLPVIAIAKAFIFTGDTLSVKIADTEGKLDLRTNNIAAEILHKQRQQLTNIEADRQQLLVCSPLAYGEDCSRENESGVDEEYWLTEWWFLEDPVPNSEGIDLVQTSHDGGSLPQSDTCCSFSETSGGSYTFNQAAADEESGDEDDTTADDNTEESNPDEETNFDNETVDSSTNYLPVSLEPGLLIMHWVMEEAPSPPHSTDRQALQIPATGNTSHRSFDLPPEKKRRKESSNEYHSDEKTCPICKKTLANYRALMNHNNRYHDRARTCPICQKTLQSIKALSDHKRYWHSHEKVCPNCQKAFRNIILFRRHRKTCHQK